MAERSLDGARCREAELQDGDEVRMGLSFVRFRRAAGLFGSPCRACRGIE